MIPRTQKKKTGGTATPRIPQAKYSKGYRMLRTGEKIKEGDHVYCFGEGPWEAVPPWRIGAIFNSYYSHPIRRIKSAKPPQSSRPPSKNARKA